MARKTCGLKKRLCPGSVVVNICPMLRVDCPNMQGLLDLTRIEPDNSSRRNVEHERRKESRPSD
jgi:hypothetical protein